MTFNYRQSVAVNRDGRTVRGVIVAGPLKHPDFPGETYEVERTDSGVRFFAPAADVRSRIGYVGDDEEDPR